jgi:hypothetical protein
MVARNCDDHDAPIRHRGVNCNSGVFYHGATAGFEYWF